MGVSEQLINQVRSSIPMHLDVFLREHALCTKEPVVLAGGAIRDIVRGETPKDYDLWLPRPGGSDVHAWLSQLSEGRPIIETKNSVSSGKYQFVTRWRWEKPYVLIDEFDFTASKWVYYYHVDNNEPPVLLCGTGTYTDTKAGYLHYSPPLTRDEASDGSLRRAFRLVARGWKLDPQSVIPLAARAMYGDGKPWQDAIEQWYNDHPQSTQTPNIFY